MNHFMFLEKRTMNQKMKKKLELNYKLQKHAVALTGSTK